MVKKYCPNCGGTIFKAMKKIPCAVKVNDKGEFEVLKEGSKIFYEVLQCAKCNEKLANDSLVAETKVKCSKCGNAFDKNILVEGLCPVCYAEKTRPDIANASKEELIAMLLDAEKLANANKSVEKKLEKAEKQEKAKEEEKPKKAKKTTKKTSKAKQEVKEQEVKEQEVKEQEVKEQEKKEELKEEELKEEEVPMSIPDDLENAIEDQQAENVENASEEVEQVSDLEDLGLPDEIEPPAADFAEEFEDGKEPF